MILHTILDPGEVLADSGSACPTYEYRRQHGRVLRLRRDAGRLSVDRVISTDPRDYLRPDYQIGAPFPLAGRAKHPNTAGENPPAGK